ncbi:MAG: nucleotidyltransferase domain-containing protein [Armatimonadetes bacterium]|nr:nucleotidyltransferase domain-containing protein [Armatimonadota bacterium]
MSVTQVDEAIEEIVRRIVEAVHPDKIILFGSHARGEAGPDSDIDLLVIGPTDEPPTRRMKPVYRALRGMRVPKDVLWWTQEEVDEWRETPGHVIRHALREGRTVYAHGS